MAVEKGQIVEVTIKGEIAGQAILNVLHYWLNRGNADADTFELGNFVEQLETDYKTWATPLASTAYFAREVSAVVITGREANPHWQDPAHPHALPFRLTFGEQYVKGNLTWAGTRVGSTLTSFQAFGVRHIAQKRGRQFRGSARWAIGVESDTNGNVWDTTIGFVGEAMAQYDPTFAVVTVVQAPANRTVNLVVFGRTTYLKAANAPLPVLTSYASEVVNEIANTYVTSQVSRKQRLRLQ